MTDKTQALLKPQSDWQRTRQGQSWAEKLRQSVALRMSAIALKRPNNQPLPKR